jgi:hypothetical protein
MTILAAFVLGMAAMWGTLWFIEWLFFAPIEPEQSAPYDGLA